MVAKNKLVDVLDFRSVTKNGFPAIIMVKRPSGGKSHPWIITNNLDVSSRSDGFRTTVSSKLYNVYDQKHDPCGAFTLPVVGLYFEGVSYGCMWLKAVIDPTELRDFRIPLRGYDPGGTVGKPCESCKERGGDKYDGHVVVPVGYYSPDENPDLFRRLSGLEIEIRFFSSLDHVGEIE